MKASVQKDKMLNREKDDLLFRRIKSNYVLKLLFDNLNFKIKMKIINHNKELKNRINITLTDYKDLYKQIIEIEIALSENKYGKFV